MTAPRRVLAPALVCVGLMSCADAPDTPLAPNPVSDVNAMVAYHVTVHLRTSDGRPLCDAAEEGGTYTFAAISEDGTLVDEFTCPLDVLEVDNVPEGTYIAAFLRQDLIPQEAERLPQFWVSRPITIEGDGSLNLRLRGIKEVPGRALFNGQPNSSAAITVEIEDDFPVISFVSNGDGEWVDQEFAWAPALLQKEVTYEATCRGGLGTKTISFPVALADTRKVDCRSPESRFVKISHIASRLVLSPEPAVLNSGDYDEFEIGYSWGVQFNEEAGEPSTSEGANLLFHASLALAMDNGSILSGGTVGDCDVCEDFSNVTNLKQDRYSEGRRVTWVYDDSESAEGVGLRVLQRSFDGNGIDYVLFHYSFENTGDEPLSFNPGVYFDWDIGQLEDNSGGTLMDGRLMYTTDPDGEFPWMGTLIISGEPAGNYFRMGGDDTSISAQLAALRGQTRRESVSGTDATYFHSASEITVAPGKRRGLWLAVVGGSSLEELEENAGFAMDDVLGSGDAALTDAGATLGGAELHSTDTPLPLLERTRHRTAPKVKQAPCAAGPSTCNANSLQPSLKQLEAAARAHLKAAKQ